MKSEFRTLFDELCNHLYEAHWFTRHTTPPTDCSDRAYLLSDYLKGHDIEHGFILTLFLELNGLHIAVVVDGLVYDPIWKLYGTPVKEYKRILDGFISCMVGMWIRYIIP
jgi:hypothetical protein